MLFYIRYLKSKCFSLHSSCSTEAYWCLSTAAKYHLQKIKPTVCCRVSLGSLSDEKIVAWFLWTDICFT